MHPQQTLDHIRHLLPTERLDDGTLLFPEGVEPYYIRTSERGTFKRCRRLWDYTSQNRRNLEPVRMNTPLMFGIAIHKGLEAYYDPERWHYPVEVRTNLAITEFALSLGDHKAKEVAAQGDGGSLDHDREQEYRDLEELGAGMLANYPDWAKERDEGITPIAVEKRYQVLIVDEDGVPIIIHNRPVVYQIRVDLIIRDKHDRLWIWDHKTAASLGDLGFLDVDTQLSTYPWVVAQILGEYPQGVIYNELVKSVPHPPKVLKKGGLSIDKRQNTTYELFVEAIEQYGLDRDDYEGMLDYLRTNPNEYYRRTPVLRTPEELNFQGQLVLQEVRDMLLGTTGEGAYLYPNPHKFNCNSCAFRVPCTIQNEQGDYEFVLNDSKLFRQRDTSDPMAEDAAN